MSYFLETGNAYGAQSTTEIYLKRVLAGDVHNVRMQLAQALEQLGYNVVEEDPVLRGRMAARGWGVYLSSADILDYPRTLTVRLKPLGANSTRATFDYVIKHPLLSKGEKAVLAREAEAITKLATVRPADKVCAICGTETGLNSRFCRQCGAPMTGEQAELEVLRLVAEIRAGHTSVVATAIFVALGSAAAVGLIAASVLAFAPKTIILLAGTGAVSLLLSLYCALFGLNRINRALRFKENVAPLAAARTLELTAAEAIFLPAQSARSSVTEGTTELFDYSPNTQEPLLTNREKQDLDALN